jgi:glycosyltransferase involved in cell wall biosynthesis
MLTAKVDKRLPPTEIIGKIKVHRVGIGYPAFDKLYLAFCGGRIGKKMHQQNRYDAVWAMMASFGGFGALAFKLKTKRGKPLLASPSQGEENGIPFLLTLQEGDPIECILHKVRFFKKRFTKIFTEADGLQAISTYLFNWGKQMGFKGKVAEVVPNGVDIERFTKEYPSEELKFLRNSFGFEKIVGSGNPTQPPLGKGRGDDGLCILVTASRLVVKNGIADVIKSLALLPEKVCFVICGVGELEESFKKLVQELKLEKRVVFLGNKSHQELPKILKACDIFIRPSITEGLGNSFLEAMAAGLPTIGTMVGGIPDFLKDGETGFVCEPNNPESIKRAVERIMVFSDEEKARVHENGLKIIRERFNWEYVVGRMKVIFEELVS